MNNTSTVSENEKVAAFGTPAYLTLRSKIASEITRRLFKMTKDGRLGNVERQLRLTVIIDGLCESIYEFVTEAIEMRTGDPGATFCNEEDGCRHAVLAKGIEDYLKTVIVSKGEKNGWSDDLTILSALIDVIMCLVSRMEMSLTHR